MQRQLWGKEFEMSTHNRKWSLVAFEYVMQWLLWTVILPDKHLTPFGVCKDGKQMQPWSCMLPCKVAVKGKQAGGEQ